MKTPYLFLFIFLIVASCANKEEKISFDNPLDILPTLIEIAGATYPKSYKNQKITPVAGVSLAPAFSNQPLERKAIFWEHEMNRAVRMGKWKLVSTGNLMDGGYGQWKYYENGPWELYNLDEDRAESLNLSGQYPEMVKEMTEMWKEWADKVPVYPTPWEKKKESIRPQYVAPILN
jgi:arylsulfatase